MHPPLPSTPAAERRCPPTSTQPRACAHGCSPLPPLRWHGKAARCCCVARRHRPSWSTEERLSACRAGGGGSCDGDGCPPSSGSKWQLSHNHHRKGQTCRKKAKNSLPPKSPWRLL